MKRAGGDPLTVYSPFELISLVFSTSRGWHNTVAQPPCRGTHHQFTKESYNIHTVSIGLPGHRNKTWYLQRWSWKESVWVCYLPWCLFPARAAWPGHNTPTKKVGKDKERKICVILMTNLICAEAPFSIQLIFHIPVSNEPQKIKPTDGLVLHMGSALRLNNLPHFVAPLWHNN